MCFQKKKVSSKIKKKGLTKEELFRELEYFKKLLNATTQPNEKAQIQFMIDQNQKWLDDFEAIDLNHDGKLQKEETNPEA